MLGSHLGKKGNSILYGDGIFLGVFFKGSPVKSIVFVSCCVRLDSSSTLVFIARVIGTDKVGIKRFRRST